MHLHATHLVMYVLHEPIAAMYMVNITLAMLYACKHPWQKYLEGEGKVSKIGGFPKMIKERGHGYIY